MFLSSCEEPVEGRNTARRGLREYTFPGFRYPEQDPGRSRQIHSRFRGYYHPHTSSFARPKRHKETRIRVQNAREYTNPGLNFRIPEKRDMRFCE